ncbi:MAG TPA: TIGR02281 family clan AA aspartic protease [Kiloniellaceae bacterium]|nr:TIGR02281 family clan AA aspartic protease [Kiloniellaceae bacterium]
MALPDTNHRASNRSGRLDGEDVIERYNAAHASSDILSSTLRNVGVLAVLCLGGFFAIEFISGLQDRPQSVAQQPAAATAPVVSGQTAAYAASVSEMELRANPYGSFLVEGRVDGTEILFLVDTGASKVSLAPQDAERLGFRANQLDFTESFHTANGIVRGAPVVIPHLRVGDIDMYDVEASVQESPMQVSLLGMTFLSRLEGYEVKGNRMTLSW